MVQVGTAGHKNLVAHRASKACKKASLRCANRAGGAGSNKLDQAIDSFFKPRAPVNPSTVSTPPPIRPGELVMPAPENHRGPLADPAPVHPMAESSGTIQGVLITNQQHVPDKKAVNLLRGLEAAVEQIPSDVPSATPEHQLNIFAADPRTCVAKAGKDEDDWFIINQMMKSSFGWGEQEMATFIPKLLNRGTYGLDRFIRFMSFFVQERGLQGALFETKVEAILKEIKDW